MFYKFNSFSQKLGSATQVSAYLSKGFREPVAEAEIIYPNKQRPVNMSNQPTLSQPLSGVASGPSGRNLGVVPADEGYRKLQQWQNKFIADDGLLVWQKLPRDRMMYRGCLGLLAAGMGLAVYQLVTWSLPKKND